MKSSLKIALGSNYEPVIKFSICSTDDIRDQLCCQFENKLGMFPSLCSITEDLETEAGVRNRLTIAPIFTNKFGKSYLECSRVVEGINAAICNERNLTDVLMWTSGDEIGWERSNPTRSTDKQISTHVKSPVLQRDSLAELDIVELTKCITRVFDSIDNWK